MIERRLLDSGIKAIAGVDEAGRGACAGPLVVAALILKNPNNSSLLQVRDSKLLSPIQRENLYPLILDQASAHAIIEIPSIFDLCNPLVSIKYRRDAPRS